MNFLIELWEQIRPQVLSGAVGLAGILITLVSAWLAKRASDALGAIKDEKRAMSLYRTIENTLKEIFARKLAEGQLSAISIPSDVVDEALETTKKNNPKAVEALSETNEALVSKIVSRIPETRAAVVEATARTQRADSV